MKKSFHTILAISLCMSLPLSAQSYNSMIQGKHEIILKGSAKIQKKLSEVKEVNDQNWSELKEINKEFKDHLAKFEDTSLDEDVRLLENAKALKARAKLNLLSQELASKNLELFDQIYETLPGMIEAANEIGHIDEKSREALAEADAMARLAVQNQKALIELIGVTEDGSLSAETEAAFEFSKNLWRDGVKTGKLYRQALRDGAQVERLKKLREVIAQRRNHLLQMHTVSGKNLDIIGMVTTGNMMQMTMRDLDNALGAITTFDEPLALEILQPGVEMQKLSLRSDFGMHKSKHLSPNRGVGESHTVPTSALDEIEQLLN